MRVYLVVLFSCFYLVAYSQFDHQSVYPGESGAGLIEKLSDNFKPVSVLNFASAKDVMYRDIYAEHDSVECVYTGHSLYLDPQSDPSSWLYQNGSSTGINAEHNYPKSKGASSGNALSDLYNLFPTRTPVNSDRGNLPFGEIPDAQTNSWYYLTGETTNIPSENIDLYSESDGQSFEPREDHKGNVARSVFYFVTMYAQETMAADPAFFEAMRSTLCDWHFYDPVDSLEWIRNERIAGFQSDKLNPFVLDCSLAARTYCELVDAACTMTGVSKMPLDALSDLTIYPNPTSGRLIIRSDIRWSVNLNLEILDLLGSVKMQAQLTNNNQSGSFEIELNLTELPAGIYLIRISDNSNTSGQSIFRKVIRR
jgi:endonuclease I